jgi:plasmid stabilization system protein ParE
MPRLIWSRAALLDVARMHRFLADKNPAAATRAVKAIRQGVKVLGQQPGIGRTIADMPEAFREWVIDFGDSGYLARYRLDAVVDLDRHGTDDGCGSHGGGPLEQVYGRYSEVIPANDPSRDGSGAPEGGLIG